MAVGGLGGRPLGHMSLRLPRVIQAREKTWEFINVCTTFKTPGPNEITRECGLRGVRTESWCPPRFRGGG